MNTKIILILLVLLGGATIIAYFSIESCRHKQQTINGIAAVVNSPKEVHTIDKKGNEHDAIQQTQLNSDAAKIILKPQLDSMASLLGIKDKQIESLRRESINSQGNFTSPVDTVFLPLLVFSNDTSKHDTVKTQHFLYTEKYHTEEGWLYNDLIKIDWTDTIPLHNTVYWNRKWFLGKKHFTSDCYSDNKHVHITGLQDIEIKKK